MGTTLRNVFLLLFFALIATKGVEFISGSSMDDARSRKSQDQRSQRQAAVARPASDAYDDYGSEMVLTAGGNGHFTLEAEIDGTPIEFMVDTGATTVVLSPQDAARVGLDPNHLDYDAVFETGNGNTPVALVTLDELRIGDLSLEDVRAAVIPKPMSMSLLGMSALERLDGYEVDGDRMILRW